MSAVMCCSNRPSLLTETGGGICSVPSSALSHGKRAPWDPVAVACCWASVNRLNRYAFMPAASDGCWARSDGYIQVSASQKMCPSYPLDDRPAGEMLQSTPSRVLDHK